MNKKSLFVLVLLSLFLVSFVSAKDLVWIEAPDAVESHMPFELKVHIEDPNVLKYTEKIYVNAYNGGAQYVEKGTENYQTYESNYSGQKEITFIVYGDYSESYDVNTMNFTVMFVSNWQILEKDFDLAELQGNYRVGEVSKLIEILPIKGQGSFPSYEGCLREEDYIELFGAATFRCQYKGDDKHPRVWAAGRNIVRHACVNDEYQKQNDLIGCSYQKKSEIGTTMTNYDAVVDVTSHTWSVPYVGEGSSEGYMRLSTNFNENRRYTPEDEDEPILYQVFYTINFYQKSGRISYSGSVSKTMWIEKDEIESEKQQIISDAESFVSSASFSKQGSLDSSKDYKSKYTTYLPGKLQDTELYVYGYLTNKDKKPLPYMLVEIYFGRDKKYEGYTDLNGNYEIELKDLKMKEDEEINATIIFNLEYLKDNKNYFTLYKYKSEGDTYSNAYIWKDLTITPDNNVELNLNFDGGRNIGVKSNFGSHIEMRDYATIYVRMHEAVEFYTERLYLNLDYKLPVEVLVGRNDKETLYSPPQSWIKIALSDMSHTSSNNPRNREYHEFSHAVMYDLYGEWPKDRTLPKTANHDGYLNPSSADSYMEGFAEFMALAIAKYQGEKDADIYAGFGSMEDNYEPWDARGYDEEFAVASLLWDIYDTNNEPGDSLSMSLDDIWRVLAVNRPNFYEYYKAFKARFPEKEKEIDEVFKLHGFFYDTREGNKKWDVYEPIRDTNNNGRYDEGEFFVDLSPSLNLKNFTYDYKFKLNISYEEGFKIGKATNYERKDRTQAVKIKDAFLKVDEKGPRFYKITVDYKDPSRETYSYIVEQRSGLLYVHPRPDDTEATITIEPETQDFTFKKKYVIENSELINAVYTSGGKGSFAEHDFVLTNLGTKNDLVYAEEGFEPSYTTDERFDEKITEKIEGEKSTSLFSSSGKKFNFFGILFRILIIGGIGFFGYKYFTDKSTRKTTHNVLHKAGQSVKKAHHEIKTKHIPKLKYHAKKAHETFKEKHLPVIKRNLRKLRAIIIETAKEINKRVKKAYKDFKEKREKKAKK